jgi:holliday junction DNA helicase RuvA
MIAQLKGILTFKSANRVVVDVNGVGYEVHIPVSTYYELGEAGGDVFLQIHTHVTESSLSLFGFFTSKERQLFLQLIQVSGIGPRLAITILSGLPLEDLIHAISAGDTGRLATIPGIGKKTAQRIALELGDKVRALFPEAEAAGGALPAAGPAYSDVVSALVNLGYPRSQAEGAAGKALRAVGGDQFDRLLKRSLSELAG